MTCNTCKSDSSYVAKNELILYNLLPDLVHPISKFLKEYLSETDVFWWDNCIIKKLSDYRIGRIIPGNLEHFDIGTILTVLNRNFDKLEERPGLKREMKFYIKEAQCMRNKLAHWKPGDTLSDEDFARNLDTLYRICSEVNASQELMKRIAYLRREAIFRIYNITVTATAHREE